MDAKVLEKFLRTPTRPFPYPWEAVHVVRLFTIHNMVARDGFATLDDCYDAMSDGAIVVKSSFRKRFLVRICTSLRSIENFVRKRISD